MNGEDSIVSGVAGRYANALFELALEAEALDAVADDMHALGDMIQASADLARLVRSPAFGTDQLVRAVGALSDKAAFHELTSNFLKLVARNRRLFVLPDMVRGFAGLVARHRGRTAAEVTSAHELSAAQLKSLAAALKSSLGSDVDLSQKVDPALLGGLVVRVGSRMIDTSLRTKLNALRLAMKEVG